ncbi:MAG: endolytic transglycosylase MltG [Actinobacteria bacterium]|nr:endolytic transglycosylase MltG [Actinomycetota bacterium]
MSNVGLSMQSSGGGDGTSGRKPKPPNNRKRSGGALTIAVLVILGLVAVVGYAGYYVYNEVLKSETIDYPGPGGDEVLITVNEGENLSQIGQTLQGADVVATTEAFNLAVNDNDAALSIAPGEYVMLSQMSAEGAVERLLDPASRNDNNIVIQEGLRTDQIVAKLSEATGIKKSEFEAVIKSPSQLPLPSWGKGSGEARADGFLFPATYSFKKSDDAKSILNEMVATFEAKAEELDFVARAKKTGYSPYEVLTIASLVQAESNGKDADIIAAAIYNRLDPDTWGGTYGLLQIDATVNYIFRKSELNFTDAEKNDSSPYNTYVHPGLPPTPINSPGEAAMEAALEPGESDVLYWLHGPDGNTCTAKTYDEHINNGNPGGKCHFE